MRTVVYGPTAICLPTFANPGPCCHLRAASEELASATRHITSHQCSVRRGRYMAGYLHNIYKSIGWVDANQIQKFVASSFFEINL